MNWMPVWLRMRQLEWRELDVRDADRWPLGLKWLCCALLAVVVCVGSYVVLALPTVKTLDEAKREEAMLLEAYRRDAARAAHLSGLREQVAALEQRLAELQTAFPEKADMASLIDDVGALALDRQLTIEAVRLGNAAETGLVVVHPVSIQVTGSFNRLGDFVADVANLPRLVTLHDVRLAVEEGRLHLSVQARAYSVEPSSAKEEG
ncbi:type 4a pilus biogenesis protein PilO [Halomonas eurihalina]|uniref:Type 4a pilus biogenesis protein PilO n=1 Tax=Halomonas eurihalina TaxID=42566 RepID=A0A5D9D7E3_HALER|nr:type 4a pilus biogenesis protein PilO [Halomonas eurihalina]MDR5858986.1 type 4a pilus biogenesis protein PilO [Halomonas eurihalina]TZG39489.1 type 4a pilus biogenesis protein PilO [Halomonas eurihalina]